MSQRLRTSLFGPVGIALILALLPSAIAQTTRKGTRQISVKPSNVLTEVSERARQSPSLTPAELAAYGNDLVAKTGFDYRFDLCDILNHRRDQTHNATSAEILHNYQMTLIDGPRRNFKLTIENPNEGLCGECWSSIPSFRVTNKEMTLIAEGERYRVRRPSSFYLDDVQLVDETLKKVLRTWQMPYQAVPTGISADGTKLYIDFYTGNDLDHLVLELSENGPPQFRESSDKVQRR